MAIPSGFIGIVGRYSDILFAGDFVGDKIDAIVFGIEFCFHGVVSFGSI